MDIVKVEDNYMILEKTESSYENYDKVKTKVRYTKNFADFTDITKDIINGINLFPAVFLSCENTADIGFAVSSFTQCCGVGQ